MGPLPPRFGWRLGPCLGGIKPLLHRFNKNSEPLQMHLPKKRPRHPRRLLCRLGQPSIFRTLNIRTLEDITCDKLEFNTEASS